MVTETAREAIKTPQDALKYAMGHIRGPFNDGDKELILLAKDPILCLEYVKYVLYPDHPIPDVIIRSIVSDGDVFSMFKKQMRGIYNFYRNINEFF